MYISWKLSKFAVHLRGVEIFKPEKSLFCMQYGGGRLAYQIRYSFNVIDHRTAPTTERRRILRIIGGHWVNRFIKRHPELKSRYTRKLDYQRAKCEDSKLIKAWFARVQETIEKYEIMKENIYNMDETGFQMGVASTAKVVCGSETKQSHARALQPGNREWVTAIIAVNAMGWSLPPQIIFAAAKHQSLWYHDLPEKYVLSVSQNGWTTDKLGIEWLQKVFEPNTTPQAG